MFRFSNIAGLSCDLLGWMNGLPAENKMDDWNLATKRELA